MDFATLVVSTCFNYTHFFDSFSGSTSSKDGLILGDPRAEAYHLRCQLQPELLDALGREIWPWCQSSMHFLLGKTIPTLDMGKLTHGVFMTENDVFRKIMEN